ncbi:MULTISPECIES: adenylate kinase [unclassified Shinella]|uniref:adenylate kinase n=1 Tax=unclassified Shinella TaxID=2643062 RepID=UPI00225D712D|nr:adenylate kinase [Shinella sp. YE25]MDC7259860.1 adenylate kinase [Shinella sp. YE25]CAI0333945.1 Adenylate kinase [Rhizobiaceae bacterium]CAK7261587.1 Adenylate kinase [Shinella sp. WSC3-e]
MRLMFLGAPGAGKGTQAEIVSRRYKIPHLSTGEILRSEVRSGTELGLSIRATMEAGGLVSDDLISDVVARRLQQGDAARGFILDGFPRNVAQAQWLDGLLPDERLDAVIELVVDEAVVLERVLNRARAALANSTEVRKDDDVDTMRVRLEAYRVATLPLSAYYREQGLLFRVGGMKGVHEVTDEILSITARETVAEPFG